MDILSWRRCRLLQQIHGYLFEGIINTTIWSLHAYDVDFFNKGKLNKGLQFGRAYQLGRVDGKARQLTRYLAGEVRPKIGKVASVAANDYQIVEEAAIKQG